MKPWLRLTLITMTVGGGFAGFAQTLGMLGDSASQHPIYLVIVVIFLALYAFVTISGLLFVQNQQRTSQLRLSLWLQVPFLSSPVVIYQFIAGFHITVSVVGGDTAVDFWLGSGWTFYLFHPAPWGFGINLFSVLMLVLLARSIRSQNVALSKAPGIPNVQSTFVEEIDQIMQRHLAQSNFDDQSVHLYNQPDGNVTIAVNDRVYQDVNAIKETAIRDIVQESINEWQENK